MSGEKATASTTGASGSSPSTRRAVTFLIADGVMPSKEGRGYVLRRILRRAWPTDGALGLHRPFLTEDRRAVVEQYGGHYGELVENKTFIENVVGAEEKRFMETLESGRVQLAASSTRQGSETRRRSREAMPSFSTTPSAFLRS